STPAVPVVNNVDAALTTSPDAARDALIRQVTGAVQWVGCVEGLRGAGSELYVEVGPGKVLTGLMRQTDRALTCVNVEDEASLARALEKLSSA
ncbi:MAG TPA: hypothetical protein VLE48_04405, partial [Terriglobales bacterium]|nr:hypothetical protein [Terriglobales bacterium]